MRCDRFFRFPLEVTVTVLNTIINELIQLLIPIAVSAIAAYVARRLVPAITAFIAARLDASQRAFIRATLEMAAHSAEAERIRVALAQGTFDALAYAIRIADDELNRYGIDLDQDTIKAGLLAELHKLRAFDDIEGITVAPVDPAATTAQGQAAEALTDTGEGARGILPMATSVPGPTLAQRRALMWL